MLRAVLLGFVVVAVGCHVWKDYSADAPGGDTGADQGCVDCVPAPWWNDAYAFRAPLTVEAPDGEERSIVLPIRVPAGLVAQEQTRPDRADLRVEFDDLELEVEVVELADSDDVVVWARFPRSPGSADIAHLYWGNPGAPVPPSPWAGYSAAFHFESDFENSVPGGEPATGVSSPSLSAGRVGGGAQLGGGASLRFLPDQLTESDVTTVTFSFRGRYTGSSSRDLLEVPRMPCRFLRIERTDDRRTAVVWTDPTTCTGNDDPEVQESVDVDLTNDAWHEVTMVWDTTEATLTLFVDDQSVVLPIDPVSIVASRVDFRGPSSDAVDDFFFDEIIIDSQPRVASEAALLQAAIRGEAFTLGSAQSRSDF